ncbi:MAG: hypothetical protein ACREO4_14350 [Lysobacter sp.]
MELEPKPICPARLLDAPKGIKQPERALLDACIAHGVSVYVRVPSKVQVHILGHDAFKGGPCIDIDNDPFDDTSRILIDYSFAGSGVIVDARMKFLRLAKADLILLRDQGQVTLRQFESGGLIWRDRRPATGSKQRLSVDSRARLRAMRRRLDGYVDQCKFDDEYELVNFDLGRLGNSQSTGPADLLGNSTVEAKLTVKTGNLYFDVDDIPKVRDLVVARLRVEDRWGHRVDAPAVYLIYQAAKHFSDREYTFAAAKTWLSENDTQGYFSKMSKALDYAAQLINRNPRKKSADNGDKLQLDRIIKNETGNDYTEIFASNRLSLLLLATDAWLHDKKQPEVDPYLPNGGLWNYLKGLGFTTTENTGVVKENPKGQTNPWECQVGYLQRIIENRP